MNDLKRRREEMMYKLLYKKYLIRRKKVVHLKNRNSMLKNTNHELLEKAIQLKERGQEAALRNSKLRTEIDYLSTDKNKLMVKNKKLYENLASLHNQAQAIEKCLGNVLNKSCLKCRLTVDEELMPVLNNQVTTKQKVSLLPEVNYQRYNFKGCIPIQDLSPIMEENADRKQLSMPPNITRRLGHRGKVLQQHKPFESLEVSELPTLEGATEANSVHSSPSPTEVVKAEVEKIKALTEESGVAECSSSLIVSNQLTDIHGKESIEKVTESPVGDLDISQQPDSIKACKDNFLPSIFANVFPRRRKRNDSGFSILSKSFTDNENNDSEFSTAVESSKNERTSMESYHRLLTEPSFDTSSKSQKGEGGNENSAFSKLSVPKTKLSVKDVSIISPSSTDIADETSEIIDLTPMIIDETPRTSKRISTERSVECSPMKKTSPRKKQGDISLSRRTLGRITDQSTNTTNSSNKASLKLLEDCINLEKSASKKIIIDMDSEKRQENRPCSRRTSGRISDHRSPSSGKKPSPSEVLDVKQTLRSKKPMNFAESPIINKKRQKKKKK